MISVGVVDRSLGSGSGVAEGARTGGVHIGGRRGGSMLVGNRGNAAMLPILVL